MAIRRALHVASADWRPRQLAIAVTGVHRPGSVARLEAAAATHLGREVVAFGSARAALAALLTVARPASGSVILPAFTCVAVPNAVATAGAATRWVDIDGANLDLGATARMLVPGDAVLAQHTYGVPIDPTGLLALEAAGAMVIEDRAHRFDGEDLVGSAAIFSLEHSKVVSAGLGGLVWTRDADLLGELRRLRAQTLPVPWLVARRVLLTSVAQVVLDARWIPRGPSSFLRRAALRFPPTAYPAQSVDELGGGQVRVTRMHPDFAAIGRIGIEQVQGNLEHRRRIGAIYRERLGELVPAWAREDRPLLRQPVVVEDAEATRLELRRAAIDLGSRWFEAPVHPAGSRSSYVDGTAPRAERLAATVLSLPTHRRVSPRSAVRIADAVLAAR